MNGTSKKDGLLRELKGLWEKGLFRSLFLVLILVLSVFIFREVIVFMLRTDYPLETPISNSMEPTLKVGDLLVVQGGLSADDIYAHMGDGDIIVFRDPYNSDKLIVHRAIEKFRIGDTWYFRTKGDNNQTNPNPDPWKVAERDLIGKVIFRIPLLGYIKIHLGTPLGMVISILLLAVLLFLENMTSSERTEKPQETRETTKGEENSPR